MCWIYPKAAARKLVFERLVLYTPLWPSKVSKNLTRSWGLRLRAPAESYCAGPHIDEIGHEINICMLMWSEDTQQEQIENWYCPEERLILCTYTFIKSSPSPSLPTQEFRSLSYALIRDYIETKMESIGPSKSDTLPCLNRNTVTPAKRTNNKFQKAYAEKSAQAIRESNFLLSRNLLAPGDWEFSYHHHEGDLCLVPSVHLTKQGFLLSRHECEERHGWWELHGAQAPS